MSHINYVTKLEKFWTTCIFTSDHKLLDPLHINSENGFRQTIPEVIERAFTLPNHFLHKELVVNETQLLFYIVIGCFSD